MANLIMANFRSPPRIQMVMRVAFLKVGKRFLKSEFSDDSRVVCGFYDELLEI